MGTQETGETRSGDQVLGLGQLLVEIDRRAKNDGLVLFRATNRPEILDFALVRPGRFHQIISFPVPSKKKREAILKFSIRRFRNMNFEKTPKLENWIIKTKG